jgi:protein phosphatase
LAQGYGYRSEQRLRKENQDTFGVFEFGDMSVLVVCDGMGGHVGGRQASSIAVRTIHDELGSYTGGDVRGALRRAIEAANRAIYEMARKNYRLMGMGTTCVAVVVQHNTAHVAHVGDSRAYLVRDGQIKALTRDHTMVNLFVDAELLSPEDAATHPEAHVLSRSLGVERQVEVDIAEPLQLHQGDRLLLCSDGIHGVIGTSGLGNVDWRNPQEGVDAALSSVERAEGDDNATLVAFGVGISGTSAPVTVPPDLATLEEEARQAPVQVALQPVRRPTLVPNAQPDAGSAQVTVVDEDVVPVEELEAESAPVPAPRPARSKKKKAASKGVDKRALLAIAGLGVVAAVGGLAFLGRGGPKGTTETAPELEERDPIEQRAALVELPEGVTLEEMLSGSGTRGMFRARCLDCTSSLSLPNPAAYLSGANDPAVAVAFFAPEIPPAPHRSPNTNSMYDHPPPSGPEQTKAVRAARNKRCREALDTVRLAIGKSIDYASLYGAAWYCFNDTDTATLAKARAATWEDFEPLLANFEGERKLPVDAFPSVSPPSDDAKATGAKASAKGDAKADTKLAAVDVPKGTEVASAEPVRGEPPSPKSTARSIPDMPDTWNIPSAGGLEYRLKLFETDSDAEGFRDIILDLLGEPTVADHLAADVLLEATAAASIARMDEPPPRALQAWARRVYIASRCMTGPVGELIRAHRPEVAGMIEALLFEATGGDEGLQAIEEGFPNEAVPPVVARAQAAGLAGQMLASEDAVTSGDPIETAGEEIEADVPNWHGSRSASRSSRRPYSRSRRSAREDVSRASYGGGELDWALKVWYPRQRMPRVLRPYQEDVEARDEGDRVQYDRVEVHRRETEQLDEDWSKTN